MNTSLYFHIPFCKQRCGYCDFTTFAGFDRLIPGYMDSLEKQVSLMGKGEPVHSVYFGGGTPSLIPVSGYQRLFKTIHERYAVDPLAEISLEANPGTVDQEKLSGYRDAGFNRISFGMQSAIDKELRTLDRVHTVEDVIKAMEYARNAGFENINLDLIFGLPGQTLEDWQYSLKIAQTLSPEHLSLYSLIVEEGTPLAEKIHDHVLPEPDDDGAAEQYEWTCSFLEEAGYTHYEISNWAKADNAADFRCQHNLQYWRLLPYLGFGCGAVGFLPVGWTGDQKSSMLMKNERWIRKYIEQVNVASVTRNANTFLHPVDLAYEMETRMFVGFRLLEEGINPEEFQKRFNVDIKHVFGTKLQKLIDGKLVEISSAGNIRLTRTAWLIANQVLREFVDEEE